MRPFMQRPLDILSQKLGLALVFIHQDKRPACRIYVSIAAPVPLFYSLTQQFSGLILLALRPCGERRMVRGMMVFLWAAGIHSERERYASLYCSCVELYSNILFKIVYPSESRIPANAGLSTYYERLQCLSTRSTTPPYLYFISATPK